MNDPNNKSTKENPVGKFMVAIGAIIEQSNTGKILIIKRSEQLDFHPGEWEIFYGRMAQFEIPEETLTREIKEETGILDYQILGINRVWHMFRGSKKAENELIGITFRCRTDARKVKISDEHSDFRWVAPEEALKLINIEGIKKDVEEYIKIMGKSG